LSQSSIAEDIDDPIKHVGESKRVKNSNSTAIGGGLEADGFNATAKDFNGKAIDPTLEGQVEGVATGAVDKGDEVCCRMILASPRNRLM